MIGIFDSGSGGLTVLSALKKRMPMADVLYFGDIKNAPYGTKSETELLTLTNNAIALLKSKGATKIISACNSVSASVAVSLEQTGLVLNQDIVEMVGPTVNHFKDSNLRIGLCATEATIKSQIYQNGFAMIGKEITSFAISDLAGAIEFGESADKLEAIIRDAITPHLGNFDVLILACTHFPLVLDIFKKILPDKIELFDPATAVATKAVELFADEQTGSGAVNFLISQDSSYFRERVNTLFSGSDYSVQVSI